jgi:hypothetical protein
MSDIVSRMDRISTSVLKACPLLLFEMFNDKSSISSNSSVNLHKHYGLFFDHSSPVELCSRALFDGSMRFS